MKTIHRTVVLSVAMLGLISPLAFAQELTPYPPSAEAPPPAIPLSAQPPGAVQIAQTGMPQAAPAQTAYTQEQLDQLLAQIALYPDPLLGQILMASTYPLEVVEAQRWLQNPQNAALKGDQLQAALQAAPWDPSVKSLVPFPQVLNMMNGNLQWTEQLGDAFLANQAAVMNEVQHLRQMAQASGNLQSTPQQTVTAQQGAIMIEPPTQQVVYVPYYDPTVVYGAWPYPGYPPYYFPPPPGYVYYPGIIGFGVGLVLFDWFWGWDHWDWFHHRLDIDPHGWAGLDPHHAAPAGGVWAHDPEHRHGVPYHSAATRAQFGGAQTAARANFRGYFTQPENRGAANANFHPSAAQYPGASHFQAPAGHSVTPNATGGSRSFAPQTRAQTAPMRAAPAATQRSAPVFESFSRGSEVRTQSMRGAASRASMPRAAPSSGNRNQHGHNTRNHTERMTRTG